MITSPILRTADQKWIIVLRILAAAPLAFFGLMHLVGAMPMRPLLEAAALPMPSLMAVLAPLVQILAGLSMLLGAFTRIGAILALGTMAGALLTHIRIPDDKWPDVAAYAENPDAWNADPVYMAEPMSMMLMAVAIMLLSAALVYLGAGPLSLDRRLTASETTR